MRAYFWIRCTTKGKGTQILDCSARTQAACEDFLL